MSSLLPLLHDLLPMIMPSEVRIARDKGLTNLMERAERPPWHNHRQRVNEPLNSPSSERTDMGITNEDSRPLLESASGQAVEPIQLLDREGDLTGHCASGLTSKSEYGITTDPGSAEKIPSLAVRADGPRIFRKDAIVGVTDKICASVLTMKPQSASAVHHYGEQDAIIYAAAGHGVLLISAALDPVGAIRADIQGKEPTREEEQPRRHELLPGDFAFIPAWTEHQVVNEGNDSDVVWVVTRSGGEPVQVDLESWGGERIES